MPPVAAFRFSVRKDDWPATSSASSKLIHGGLRYLEHYEFRLVREAPQNAKCCLPKHRTSSSQCALCCLIVRTCVRLWMIRAGMFLYDNLGKREKLPASRTIHFGADSPLNPSITRGFEYSDCWVDDARLVVLNAMSARENGAHIHTQTRCVSARRIKGMWHLHRSAATAACFRSMPRHWSMRQAHGWPSSSVKTSSSTRLTASA